MKIYLGLVMAATALFPIFGYSQNQWMDASAKKLLSRSWKLSEARCLLKQNVFPQLVQFLQLMVRKTQRLMS